ncbi:MAG: class I lanthipeptide [Thermoanaerobaculia bacterium]
MKKKLVLNKETLRRLTSSNLQAVLGGSLLEPTHYSICPVICSGNNDSDQCSGDCQDTEI